MPSGNKQTALAARREAAKGSSGGACGCVGGHKAALRRPRGLGLTVKAHPAAYGGSLRVGRVSGVQYIAKKAFLRARLVCKILQQVNVGRRRQKWRLFGRRGHLLRPLAERYPRNAASSLSVRPCSKQTSSNRTVYNQWVLNYIPPLDVGNWLPYRCIGVYHHAAVSSASETVS